MTREVLMPRLGVNDDTILLVTWQVEEGTQVTPGQVLASIESSKESSEIVSEAEGLFVPVAAEGSDIAVGACVARILDAEDAAAYLADKAAAEAAPKAPAEAAGAFESLLGTPVTVLPELLLTNKARALAEKLQLDFSGLPRGILLREKDILALTKSEDAPEESSVPVNSVLIYGAGHLGKMAAEVLKTQHIFRLAGFVDSHYPDLKEVLGVPVLGGDEQLDELYAQGYTKIFNAIGFLKNRHWRKAPYEMLRAHGFEPVSVIHRSAQIEASAQIGVGSMVYACACIGPDAAIGDNCLINAHAVIAHDCRIGDHCHIASGAVLAGGVTVGENTLIGQNVSVYFDVKIGSNVVIPNGCSILTDVPDGTIVRG